MGPGLHKVYQSIFTSIFAQGLAKYGFKVKNDDNLLYADIKFS